MVKDPSPARGCCFFAPGCVTRLLQRCALLPTGRSIYAAHWTTNSQDFNLAFPFRLTQESLTGLPVSTLALLQGYLNMDFFVQNS